MHVITALSRASGVSSSSAPASLQALFDDADASLKGQLKSLMGTKSRPPPKPSRSKSRQGKPKKCNCKNSKCLKLYCDCFSAGVMCDGCA